VSGRRLPASPDRLDAEMRSLRFMHENLVKTVTDELRAVRSILMVPMALIVVVITVTSMISDLMVLLYILCNVCAYNAVYVLPSTRVHYSSLLQGINSVLITLHLLCR